MKVIQLSSDQKSEIAALRDAAEAAIRRSSAAQEEEQAARKAYRSRIAEIGKASGITLANNGFCEVSDCGGFIFDRHET